MVVCEAHGDPFDFLQVERYVGGVPAFITIKAEATNDTTSKSKRYLRLKGTKTMASPSLHDRRATQACYSMIDLERDRHDRRPLVKNPMLHQLAREHAVNMATEQHVFHAVDDVEELRFLLECPSASVAHSVKCGSTVAEIHESTMQRHKSSLLSQSYREYGVAIATGKDGKLYACFFFRAKAR